MPLKIYGRSSGSSLLKAPDSGDTEVEIYLPKRTGKVKNSISSNVTYQIGATGDYSTLNAAIQDLQNSYPEYSNAGITVTLNLQTGYVMAEQVLVYGIDLGWITITGTDAETEVTSSALTIDFTTEDYGFGTYPVFGVSKGGTGPIINQLFSFDITGVDTSKHGIFTVGSGSSIDILSGAGCKGADGNNIYANRVSSIECNTAIASGAGLNGIFASNGSIINANSVDASGAGSNGIYAANGSTIGADGANASGAGTNGIYARGSSTINANGANASGAGTIGIYALNASSINANSADCSGAGQYGIRSTTISIIDANNANCGTAGTYGFFVSNSGIIDITNGTGTTSQTLDTWTTNGYIS